MKVLVELLRGYFQEAADRLGVEEKHFVIGGNGVRFRFAGKRWSGLLSKALAHLEDATGFRNQRPPLTVCLWDGGEQAGNVVLRAYLDTLAYRWPDYAGPRGDLLDLHQDSVLSFYHPGPDILSVVELEENIAFYWKRDLSPLPYYEVGSPLRTLLHAWLRKQGVQLVHGGAVGTARGGVLLAGKGGSGKSTSVLACLDSSLKYASDDYCMVGSSDSDNGPLAYSLYNSAKLRGAPDLALFPQLASRVWNPVREPSDKALIFLDEHFPHRMICSFPLQAILVPAITDSQVTRIERCGAAETLLALAPSTMAQLPGSGPEDLNSMARLVRQVPCYKLFLGSAIERIPLTIEALLSSLVPQREPVPSSRMAVSSR